jgi:EAL domain-containing protein (putative c-di-GMP-specific phosphodiesterase class I)
VAESSGLILRMGLDAAAPARRWRDAAQRPSLSVNVSQRQFRQDDFVERVRAVLELPAPGRPSDPGSDRKPVDRGPGDTIARMTELVRMGVRFSIDDFGTGYSSLAYLKRLPLFELKIDRSFVQDTPDDPNDTAIVQSISPWPATSACAWWRKGWRRAQADFLTASRCDYLQGYLFGRPEPLEGWLQRHPT